MNRLVLDCSAAAAWLFGDEFDQEAERLLDLLLDGSMCALVSTTWYLEVGEVLIRAERRGRISAVGVWHALDILAEVPITPDTGMDGPAFSRIFRYARSARLSTFDASNLELAARYGIPLASRNKPLLRAAGRLGIEVFSARSHCGSGS